MTQVPNTDDHEQLNTSAFKVKLENFFYEVEETTFKTKEDAIKFLRESEGNDFYTKSELLEIKQNTATKGEIKMMNNEENLDNSYKEQKGLEILDIDNLKEFTTLCNKLPLDFKSQYILEDDNALTLLIVKVAENIEEYKRFFEEVEGNEYEYAYQAQHVAFSKTLGFEDDEHLSDWINENPIWCDDTHGLNIFNNCEHQGFVTAGASTYQELIDALIELHDTYNFLVYNNA